MTTDNIPMDKLVRVYRRIRGEVQTLTQEYEAKVAELKEQQAMVAASMREEMQRLNVTSLKTADGLVLMSTKHRFYATDWDAFSQFLIKHHALDLLEKRIAQRNMDQYLKENPEMVPPGLASDSEVVITVRKP